MLPSSFDSPIPAHVFALYMTSRSLDVAEVSSGSLMIPRNPVAINTATGGGNNIHSDVRLYAVMFL